MYTHIKGIPCEIEVTYYQAPRPMLVTGMGMGDAEPPEPEEIEFMVRDRKGYPAPWLEDKLDGADIERIKDELLKEDTDEP